jgi:hypothetical protein
LESTLDVPGANLLKRSEIRGKYQPNPLKEGEGSVCRWFSRKLYHPQPMNLRFSLLAATFVAFGLLTGAQAQDVSKEAQVDIKNVQIQQNTTPDYNPSLTKPKRVRYKDWMEVEVTFDVKKEKVSGDRNPVVDSLEFKFFIALNKTTKEGKTLMLKGDATFLNAVERSDNVAMMFVSPSSLFRLLEKNGFTGADVKAWGIEVYYNGAVAGWKSSTGPSRWWVDGAASLQPIEGLLLPKAKTPFAPLWGDYDLETAVR